MLLKETVQKQTGLVIVWLSSTWIFDPLAIISNSSIYVTLKIRTNFSYFSGVKKSITNECVYSPDVRKKYKKVYYVSKWIVNNILFQWKILCFSKTIYPQLWREGEIFILSPCYHIFSQFRSEQQQQKGKKPVACLIHFFSNAILALERWIINTHLTPPN